MCIMKKMVLEYNLVTSVDVSHVTIRMYNVGNRIRINVSTECALYCTQLTLWWLSEIECRLECQKYLYIQVHLSTEFRHSLTHSASWTLAVRLYWDKTVFALQSCLIVGLLDYPCWIVGLSFFVSLSVKMSVHLTYGNKKTMEFIEGSRGTYRPIKVC